MLDSKRKPDHEHQHIADRERPIVKQMKIDDRVLVAPFPDNHRDQRDNGDRSHHHDEVRTKPIIALSFVEHHLQRAKPKCKQSQPDVVNSAKPVFFSVFMYGGSEISRFVSSSEIIPTGMLMKKIQRHEKLSVIHPPSVGPIAGASTTAIP